MSASRSSRRNGPTHHGEYAALQIAGLRLVLQHTDIRTMEPYEVLDAAEPPPQGVGWVTFQHQRVPVFELGADMQLVAALQQPRRLCVVLGSDQRQLGLLCDEIFLLESDEVQVYALPEVMRQGNTPFDRLVVFEDGIGCVASAENIYDYVTNGRTHEH